MSSFWGKLFTVSVKRCGTFLCLFGLDDTYLLPVNMSLKYFGKYSFEQNDNFPPMRANICQDQLKGC